ncbi:BlaI/MecI/CopY family transcriptional regulator [Candidatus Gottesmanbacteria bacterium]|nr:BlaI/MecI/CopY family transcriptional regulator [Candidatus Gottesmanbacteria bacterium]
MKAKSLGELEQQIMDIVWEYKHCSARDILNRLETEKKLAYTTIATILHRLHGKGLVERKGDGLAYIYSPKLTKESYSKNLAQSFLKKFIHSFGDVAIASFAASIDRLPKGKREYFLTLLEKYDKTK